MDFNFDAELAMYRLTQALKKTHVGLYDGVILFNQEALIACGRIHAAMMLLPDGGNAFKQEHGDFFDGFPWAYYTHWRKTRAKSCAHLLDVYTMLNVKLSVHDFVGETFYAGIPPVTLAEVNWAIEHCQIDGDDSTDKSGLKVGIDGKLHPCDKCGDFLEIVDGDDIYADGTGVSMAELQEAVGHGDTLPCLTCAHAGGNGDICRTCGTLALWMSIPHTAGTGL